MKTASPAFAQEFACAIGKSKAASRIRRLRQQYRAKVLSPAQDRYRCIPIFTRMVFVLPSMSFVSMTIRYVPLPTYRPFSLRPFQNVP